MKQLSCHEKLSSYKIYKTIVQAWWLNSITCLWKNCFNSKLLFHFVFWSWCLPLKASACCSTDSLTIFQKQSDTARLKFFVVTWCAFSIDVLWRKIAIGNYSMYTQASWTPFSLHKKKALLFSFILSSLFLSAHWQWVLGNKTSFVTSTRCLI